MEIVSPSVEDEQKKQLRELGVFYDISLLHEMASYQARLQTFAVGWPEHAQQTPEALARSGFYYCGTFLYCLKL